MNKKNTHRTVTYYNIITRQIKGAVRGAGRSKRGGGGGGGGGGGESYLLGHCAERAKSAWIVNS